MEISQLKSETIEQSAAERLQIGAAKHTVQTSTRLRILFLPADSIEPPISRSYHLARGLSSYADVYYVVWSDPRTAGWQGKSEHIGRTLVDFARTLLQRFRMSQPDPGRSFYRVSASILLDAVIHRLVGRTRAAKLKYAYNRRTLEFLIRKLRPDVVFYGDGFYFFPAVDGPHVSVSDIQDDVNWAAGDRRHASFAKSFGLAQLKCVKRAYIVSGGAIENMNSSLATPTEFTTLPNGAEFEQIRGVPGEEVQRLRDQHGLNGKYVASYIGGDIWFDTEFATRFFAEAERRMPDVQFVIVGNVPRVPGKKVTWVGAVPPATAAAYYRLSDIGLLLRDSQTDPFLFNSVPLKIIQYAAARKPVLVPPLSWTEAASFGNVFSVRSMDAADWCNRLAAARNEFQWTTDMDREWEPYSWEAICRETYDDLTHISR